MNFPLPASVLHRLVGKEGYTFRMFLLRKNTNICRPLFKMLSVGAACAEKVSCAEKRQDDIFRPWCAAQASLRMENLWASEGFLIDIFRKESPRTPAPACAEVQAIGTLAGGIAHDFNNLLMGILGNLSIMLMHMDTTHPFYGDRLKIMEDYVHRGSNLTRQLLGFARGEQVRGALHGPGQIRYPKRGNVWQNEKGYFHSQAGISNSLWHVDVDRGQMDQVLLNLFVNAWRQAMPDGENDVLYL